VILQIELRTAPIPWHVLGEEPAAAARCVTLIRRSNDCKLKRADLVGDRLPSLVNGHRRAAAPDRHERRRVAGVRYRAWQPPVCLQPTIKSHAPLRF